MGKIKILFIIFLFLIFTFRIWQTIGCKRFVDYKFIPLSVKINVESQTALDYNLNRSTSRIFHNKISATFYELSKSYLATFRPNFLLETLGPIGLLSFIFAIYWLIRNKNAILFGHLVLVLLLPLLLMFISSPRNNFYILALSRYSFSFWGIGYFTKTFLSKFLLIILFIYSIYYFLFSWQM